MSNTQPTQFEHLTPCEPSTSLHSCDLCYASEADDIIANSTIETMFSIELIPMYLDARDGICVCQRCAESGVYLEMETATT